MAMNMQQKDGQSRVREGASGCSQKKSSLGERLICADILPPNTLRLTQRFSADGISP